MITIAVVNRKGGVGKTTTAVHLAGGLATLGFRAGCIDTDSQGHMALMFGMPEENGLFDVLIENKPLEDCVRFVPPENYSTADNPSKGALYLLPGAEKTFKIPHELDETKSFAFVELVDNFATTYKLDVVIIDTNPTMSKLDGAVWLATDAYLYVVECERLSFDGLIKAIDQLKGFATQRKRYLQRDSFVLGIVPNKLKASTELHRENLSNLKEQFGDMVWDPITNRINWASATNSQQLVYTFFPSGPEAKDAWKMVNKAMEVLGWVKDQA